MPQWLEFQGRLHWLFFAAGFLVIGLWETYRPLRKLVAPNGKRWAGHIVMASLGHLTTLLTPISATAVAMLAAKSTFGLLNHSLLPWIVQCCLAIALLDLVRWAQHYSFHKFAILWRMHRVHHSDPDYDLTTTLRFHPIEVLLTQASYLAAVYVIAPPPAVALGVELALLLQNFFGHANTSLPPSIEARLRRFLVTPDMHRIHHSAKVSEQNHNFGTMFPWWDRFFGSYLEEPEGGAERMQIGIRGYADERCLSVVEMVLLPFRSLSLTETPAPPSEQVRNEEQQAEAIRIHAAGRG